VNKRSEINHASRMDVRRQARDQVAGLSAQFLFGMAISLIGPPSQTTGAAHTISSVLLGLHVLVGAALIAGAAVAVHAARNNDWQRRLARWGAAAIVLTFGAGITTLITKSNWWSYAMAVGFIVSLLVYVSILVQAGSAGGGSAVSGDHGVGRDHRRLDYPASGHDRGPDAGLRPVRYDASDGRLARVDQGTAGHHVDGAAAQVPDRHAEEGSEPDAAAKD